MMTYFKYYEKRIAFKEITFKSKQAGVNSMDIPKIVQIGFTALWDFNEFRREIKQSKRWISA